MKIFKSFVFILVFVLLSLPVNGQVTVVEVTTDTVSIFNNPEQSEKAVKSAKLAMLASAVVPGTGQQYFGKNRSALVYFGLDVFSFFGAVFLEKYSRQLKDDALGYASMHAGVDPRGKDEQFGTMLGRFECVKDYNTVLGLDRQDDQMYTDESKNWAWANNELYSEQHQKKYNDLRDASRKVHTVAAICIGAMIINRIVSVVDIRASTRYKANNEVSSLRLHPTISSDFSSAGLSVSAGF